MVSCLFSTFVFAQDQHFDFELRLAEQLKSSSPDSAFQLLIGVYKNSDLELQPMYKGRSALLLGEILYYLGDFNLASYYLNEAHTLFVQSQDLRMTAKTLIWKGIVTQYARQYPMVLSNYSQALSIYADLNDSLNIGETMGWIGHYYEKINVLDSAIWYQKQAEFILLKTDVHELSLAKVYDNLGSIYEDEGSFDSARMYFEKAIKINMRFNDINSSIVNLNNVGDTYRKEGSFNEALKYADSALNLATRYQIKYQIRSAHRDLSKIYSAQGEYQLSHWHLENAYNMNAEILGEENSHRIALLQTVYETDRKETAIDLLEKDKRFNQLLRYAMIGVVILIITASIYFIRDQRLKVKKNRQIIDQQSELLHTREEMSQLEIKNARIKEEKLVSELESRISREVELEENILLKGQLITSHTLQIIRKNNFLTNIKTNLDTIKKSEKKDRNKAIHELIKLIDQDIAKDEDWEDFNLVFGQVHKDFFTYLKCTFPDLSPAEIRLCSLLKLNLHSQDIATILGVSQDSLRIARYRLRKKLQLKKNDNLVSVLMNI